MLLDKDLEEKLLSLGYKTIEVCSDEEDEEYYLKGRFDYFDSDKCVRTDGRHHLTGDKNKPDNIIEQAKDAISAIQEVFINANNKEEN